VFTPFLKSAPGLVHAFAAHLLKLVNAFDTDVVGSRYHNAHAADSLLRERRDVGSRRCREHDERPAFQVTELHLILSLTEILVDVGD
jgi:hypothetical protein